MLYAAHHKEQQAEILEGLQALRALYTMLRSNPQLDPRTGQYLTEDKRPSNDKTVTTKEAITASDLLNELDFDGELVQNDL